MIWNIDISRYRIIGLSKFKPFGKFHISSENEAIFFKKKNVKGGKMFEKISKRFFPYFLFLFIGSSLLLSSGSVYTEKLTGMEFVLIKGRCYEMGDSYGDGDVIERPVQEVCVNDFYISKFEVTNAQYRKFKPDHSSGKHDGISLDDDSQPVVNVSWYDAVNFAN